MKRMEGEGEDDGCSADWNSCGGGSMKGEWKWEILIWKG